MLFGLIQTKKDKTAANVDYSLLLQAWSNSLMNLFGTPKQNTSGQNVTTSTVKGIAAVSRCVTLIADGISVLDFGMYKKSSDGKITEIFDSPSIKVLQEPNPFQTWIEFINYSVTSLMYRGNSYSLIIRDQYFRVKQIYPLNPDAMTIQVNDAGKLEYLVGNTGTIYQEEEIIHVKINCTESPFMGENPIYAHASTFGVSLAAKRGQGRVYETGMLKFLLSSPQRHAEVVKSAASIKQSINDVVNGEDLSAILPDGVTMQKLSLTPNEAGFVESMKYSDLEISRIFKTPASMIDAKENNATSEDEYQHFYATTLQGITMNFEAVLKRRVMTEKEKAEGCYYSFKYNALLRVSAEKRALFYQSGIRNSWLNAATIARWEGLPEPENGNTYYIPQDIIPVDQYPDLIKAKIINLESKKVTNEQGSNQDNIL